MTPKKSIISEILTEFGQGDVVLTPDSSWSRFTTMGAGAAPFCMGGIYSVAHAKDWISACRQAGVKLFPLGGGSNVAGSDSARTDLLVLRLLKNTFTIENGILKASGGCVLRTLLKAVFEAGFGGMAPLSGIPGTLGGALFMNAGANGSSISDFLLNLEILNLQTGEVTILPKEAFPWEYRHSGIKGDQMVLSAELAFPVCQDKAAEEDAWRKEALRRSKAPKGRSAGSIFKNPGDGLPSAGKLLEDSGAKGMRCGAFFVAQEHANWILNDGSAEARSEDLLNLIRTLQKLVQDRFSILLKPEIRFIDLLTGKR